MAEDWIDWITKDSQASGKRTAEINFNITYPECLGLLKTLCHQHHRGWVSSANIRVFLHSTPGIANEWVVRSGVELLRLEVVRFPGNRVNLLLRKYMDAAYGNHFVEFLEMIKESCAADTSAPTQTELPTATAESGKFAESTDSHKARPVEQWIMTDDEARLKLRQLPKGQRVASQVRQNRIIKLAKDLFFGKVDRSSFAETEKSLYDSDRQIAKKAGLIREDS